VSQGRELVNEVWFQELRNGCTLHPTHLSALEITFGTLGLIVISRSKRIAALTQELGGTGVDSPYLAFFECFNRQLFYEAHEVLEVLWHAHRGAANDRFYKGLIQLAGAFVHLQKDRPGPAASLFELARKHLQSYPPIYERLDLEQVIRWIEVWLEKLGAGTPVTGLLPGFRIELLAQAKGRSERPI